MSLARWIEGDVYVFYDATGGITCMCCRFMPLAEVRHEKGSVFEFLNGSFVPKSFHTKSRTAMLSHLKMHTRSRGTGGIRDVPS